ncbi:hypothetical protein EQG68_02615 [Flavobacterium piscinae]|uniref:DUF3575 domain-containing protein n=2 Tax=Flavobacterium piscinae TaxID=2506424 RepID=A0A4Q1KZ34_9FLAO|nr:hypothetical protein [Flavobacterium piscinae]RXR34819.1 hypothetical protein EQG68_02615 [Flavobacterium piscinae]
MKIQKIFTLLFIVFICKTNVAQSINNDTISKKYFIGSSLFMLGNFDKKNTPDFVQLNLGYRITKKDVISLEFKTWKYAWPLGIPYGDNFEAENEKFPGYIREKGVALVYQRFWWKGLYTSIHSMSAWQNFIDENDRKLDKGFQIFNTYRIGYQIKLFKNKFFIEPSIAVTHRPYHTKMPESFKQLDDKWSKFFWGEPGLHFGFNF